jgi:uncharacterized protein (TIGR00661 family)
MRILYAVQGTGNGHLSRAKDIVPCLQKLGEVDILVSGIQGDLPLPFPITYKLKGLSFIFGSKGGVNLWKTMAKADFRKLTKAINALPVEDYDLVINDFEPVSAWACNIKGKACVSLSHQAVVLSKNAPRPERRDALGTLILNHYAPASIRYGFHFEAYDENIFTPVIRKEVREQPVDDRDHYTVYLPSYDDNRLIKQLSAHREVRWEVFSKHNSKLRMFRNITIQPINSEKFTQSMAQSSGVLCGAGFETPAEALYLGKKLLVIPMKNQYEQHLNAAALQQMGVPVMKSLKSKHQDVLTDWLHNGKVIQVDYPDQTQKIIKEIVKKHADEPVLDWFI